MPSIWRIVVIAMVAVVSTHASMSNDMLQCEQWKRVEISIYSSTQYDTVNPFLVPLSATFELQSSISQTPKSMVVGGFYDGDSNFKIRFSPPLVGVWKYVTESSDSSISGITGTVTATLPTGSGPVVTDGFNLRHADGSRHYSTGTTCYQWAHKDLSMQQQTVDTLQRTRAFNKIRMTVFPKWYQYNHANPVEVGTVFDILPNSNASNQTTWNCVGSDCESVAGSFDLRRFNISFWQNLELRVSQLEALNIVADLIVFHPYDNGHWGFDCLGGRDPQAYNTTNDKFYLQYLAARMSSFQNVWWSMANEWNNCKCKSRGVNSSAVAPLPSPSPVWDDLFETLSASDPYTRQMSIHNGQLLYNHSRPWITHVSLQGLEDQTPQIRALYQKPVIWDEVRYEGNVSDSWGALSGEEETDRFWWGNSLGVHVGHSETILRNDVTVDDEQPLWWAKGGTLHGTSPLHIAYLRTLWGNATALPEFGELVPSQSDCGSQAGTVANILSSVDPKLPFHFVHFDRAGLWTLPIATDVMKWNVIVVDYWGMTTHPESSVSSGNVTVDVPYIPYNIFVVGTTA
eukprot:m.162246 g.162246  ORF g.162246 m.162246 type:complete len:571 (-) comp31269_c2_seq3:159-1871(-)